MFFLLIILKDKMYFGEIWNNNFTFANNLISRFI